METKTEKENKIIDIMDIEGKTHTINSINIQKVKVSLKKQEAQIILKNDYIIKSKLGDLLNLNSSFALLN